MLIYYGSPAAPKRLYAQVIVFFDRIFHLAGLRLPLEADYLG